MKQSFNIDFERRVIGMGLDSKELDYDVRRGRYKSSIVRQLLKHYHDNTLSAYAVNSLIQSLK